MTETLRNWLVWTVASSPDLMMIIQHQDGQSQALTQAEELAALWGFSDFFQDSSFTHHTQTLQ